MAVQSYQELEVWKVAMDLDTECYRVTKAFPKDELFGMTSQIRRSAASIPANIAEGQGREHTKEFLNHVSIAKGIAQGTGNAPTPLSALSGLLKAADLPSLMTLCDRISPDALTSPPSSGTAARTPHASGPDAPRSSGSAVDAARRAGYPWPEQMARKMLRNVEKRGVQAARNGPSEDRKCWQRVELGIHGLNR